MMIANCGRGLFQSEAGASPRMVERDLEQPLVDVVIQVLLHLLAQGSSS
jgi:hypothetical protein